DGGRDRTGTCDELTMIDYDGRRFRAVGHGPDAAAPVASYRQCGDLLWAEFSGGPVRRGSLTGVRHEDDTIEFTYTMVLTDGSVLGGHCASTPEILPDGRVRLRELTAGAAQGKPLPAGTSRVRERSESMKPAEAVSVPRPVTGGLSVVVTSVASDSHTWNLVFLQLALEELGHRVVNLGACVPDELLVAECLRVRPDLIVVSSVNGHGFRDGTRLIGRIRACPELATTVVVIGGKLGIAG